MTTGSASFTISNTSKLLSIKKATRSDKARKEYFLIQIMLFTVYTNQLSMKASPTTPINIQYCR